MKLTIVTTVFLAVQFCFAQEADREYFNEWGGSAHKDSASYYTEWSKLDSGYLKTAYYSKTNAVKFKENYRQNIKTGKCIYYHPNGEVQSEALYYNNQPLGLVKSYYPSGRLQVEELYDSAPSLKKMNSKEMNYKILNFYDSTGAWLTKNGFGKAYEYERSNEGTLRSMGNIIDGLKDSIWTSHYPSGKLHYSESWNKGTFIEGKSYWTDGTTYTYQLVDEMAEPMNGMQTFYNYVGMNMRYPTKARRNGIEGRVFTEFIVEKDGSISHIKVIRGIGGGCDEEAIRVIGSSPRWKPGLQRGRPVRTRFNLALIFKLS